MNQQDGSPPKEISLYSIWEMNVPSNSFKITEEKKIQKYDVGPPTYPFGGKKNGFYLISFIRIYCKWVTFKYPKLELLENMSTLRN